MNKPTHTPYAECDHDGNVVATGGHVPYPAPARPVGVACAALLALFLYTEGPALLAPDDGPAPAVGVAYVYGGPAQDAPLSEWDPAWGGNALSEGAAVSVRERARRAGKENSVLWLARLLVSETDRPAEWPAIGSVVRNRVKSPRYPDWYHKVVLQDRQFSAFNRSMPASRRFYTRIGWDGRSGGRAVPGWEDALEVALHVVTVGGPLPGDAHHFYHRDALTVEGAAGNRHARTGCPRLGGVPHPEWMHRPTARVVHTHRDLVVVAGL